MAIEDHVPNLFLDPVGHGVGFREDEVADEDFGAVFQGGDEVPEDLDALPVRPVVEDEAEEVGVCALDGLWVEEIVSHEFDSVVVFCRERRLGIIYFFLVKILNDELLDLKVVGYFKSGVAA